MSEDDFIYWEDALSAVKNNRLDKLGKCPFCYQGVITITKDPPKTRLECQSCHHFIEGRFGDDEHNF